MPEQDKIAYSELEPGYEFPEAFVVLDSTMVSAYLSAVGDNSPLFRNTGIVPPMAIAAHALAALTEVIDLPPGTIHVSQELEFAESVQINDTIITRAKVAKKQTRGQMQMMTIEIGVFDQEGRNALSGRSTFLVPYIEEP